ncbi:MAG TPA: polymer-forming cytoskeletal protein [Arenicellales bacterium]|nr:polymer-forming cytoskeletal protein [Arenicellales bacterium]
MWGNKRKHQSGRIDTLVGQDTVMTGDLRFSGGLHVDGSIVGNVISEGENEAVLMLSERGRIQGEVRVPNVVLNGQVEGDVHAGGRIELGQQARVTGNVYYHLLEMAMGAEVNGNLVHQGAKVPAVAKKPVDSQGKDLSPPQLAAQDNS